MTATAAAATETQMPLDPPNALVPQEAPPSDPIMNEVRIGVDRLREMTPQELRGVIATRVEMLENVLKDREHRREAIQTAKIAAKIYDVRHQRSHKIHRSVNYGSAIAAVLSTCLIIVIMV